MFKDPRRPTNYIKYEAPFFVALEDEQLAHLKDGGSLQTEGMDTGDAPPEGLKRSNIDKHQSNTSIYRNKALVRPGAEPGTFEGLASGRLFEDNEVNPHGGFGYRENADRYHDLLKGPNFQSSDSAPHIFRTILATDIGCEILPKRVQPFIMKRNSPMLQQAINNKKKPKHIRRFLNRNASRVDGFRSVPQRENRVSQGKPRMFLKGLGPLYAIIQSALLQKSWKTASKAFAMLIRSPSESVPQDDLHGIGIQILTEIKKPPRDLSTCSSYLNFLILEMTWLAINNRQNNSFTQKQQQTSHLISKSDDFLRCLVLVHLKLRGSPEELLTRLDEDMMVPPYTRDRTLNYLRGVVLLRCVYHNIERYEMLSKHSLSLLDRARGQFEIAHEGGVIFDLQEYQSILSDISNSHAHGEVKREIADMNSRYSESYDDQDSDSATELLAEADEKERKSSSSEEARSDEEVPWWETLNSDGDDDDDEIKVDDESDLESKVDEDSKTEVKAEKLEEFASATPGSDVKPEPENDEEFDFDISDESPPVKPEPEKDEEFDFDMSDGTPPVKPEPQEDYDFDNSDSDETPVKNEPRDDFNFSDETPPVKPEPQEDHDFDFGGDDSSENDTVIKTESPPPEIKKDQFATLDDLLGSLPEERTKGKKKAKKEKKKKVDFDDDMDFDF